MTVAILGQSWRDLGACGGRGDLFSGPDDERAADREARERAAKRVCAPCPVKGPCLAWGESQPESVRRGGVYGGLGEKDRERLRRHLGQARRRAAEGKAS